MCPREGEQGEGPEKPGSTAAHRSPLAVQHHREAVRRLGDAVRKSLRPQARASARAVSVLEAFPSSCFQQPLKGWISPTAVVAESFNTDMYI